MMYEPVRTLRRQSLARLFSSTGPILACLALSAACTLDDTTPVQNDFRPTDGGVTDGAASVTNEGGVDRPVAMDGDAGPDASQGDAAGKDAAGKDAAGSDAGDGSGDGGDAGNDARTDAPGEGGGVAKRSVLVVINDASSTSVAVGAAYMQGRGLTEAVHVRCVDSAASQDNETLSFDDYQSQIETPIRSY